MIGKVTWKARLGGFIPRYIPNRLVVGTMSLLGILHRTRRDKSEENREHNLKVLAPESTVDASCGIEPVALHKEAEKVIFVAGEYIENKVDMLYCRREEVVKALGAESDAVIATVYNDARDIFKMIHTVNISQDEAGKYHAHNCYKMNSKKEFISDGPYETLWEAIHKMGQGKSEILCVMGIKPMVECLNQN